MSKLSVYLEVTSDHLPLPTRYMRSFRVCVRSVAWHLLNTWSLAVSVFDLLSRWGIAGSILVHGIRWEAPLANGLK